MPSLSFELGEDHYAQDQTITKAAFGAEYLGVRIFKDDGNDFVPAIQNEIGYHHLRWAGDNVETQRQIAYDSKDNKITIEKYGFEFEDFVNPAYVRDNGSQREGLSDMFSFANERELSFALVAPTARYIKIDLDDPGAGVALAVEELAGFLQKLKDGAFGQVPDEFTIELGSEYYGIEPYVEAGEDKTEVVRLLGEVTAAMAAKIAEFETYNDIDINVAAQLGRMSNFENDIILEAFTSFDASLIVDDDGVQLFLNDEQSAIEAVDSVIWHRYVTRFDGINNGLWDPIEITDENGQTHERSLSDLVKDWEEASGKAMDLIGGFSAPSLNGVSDDNLGFGPLKPEHLEESLTYILEITTGLLAEGMDFGSLYGVGSGSFGTYAFQDKVFIGGDLWGMMADSLPGTHVVEGFQNNLSPFERTYDAIGDLEAIDPITSDHVNSYVFENDEKVVIFLVAKDFAGNELEYDLTLKYDDFDITTTELSTNVDASHLWAGDEYVDPWGQNIAVFGETRDDVIQATKTETGLSLNVVFSQDYEAIRLIVHKQASSADVESITDFDNEDRVLVGDFRDNHIDGSEGEDELTGLKGNDTLIGQRGDDSLIGGNGADELSGGLGNDQLRGGYHADLLYGEEGNDTVFGGNGRDTAWLGDGDDTFFDSAQSGWLGQDRVFGGDGNDNILGVGGNDSLYGERGQDKIVGGAGSDLISGGSGYDTLFAATGDDTVHGGHGRDRAFLGDGDDVFHDTAQAGKYGDDRVFGGSGNDTIYLDGGNDTAFGGAGEDAFHFVSSTIENDVIRDFAPGIDVLHLDQDLWGQGLSVKGVIDSFASVEIDGVKFDFGNGNTILLENVTSVSELENSITLFDDVS